MSSTNSSTGISLLNCPKNRSSRLPCSLMISESPRKSVESPSVAGSKMGAMAPASTFTDVPRTPKPETVLLRIAPRIAAGPATCANLPATSPSTARMGFVPGLPPPPPPGPPAPPLPLPPAPPAPPLPPGPPAPPAPNCGRSGVGPGGGGGLVRKTGIGLALATMTDSGSLPTGAATPWLPVVSPAVLPRKPTACGPGRDWPSNLPKSPAGRAATASCAAWAHFRMSSSVERVLAATPSALSASCLRSNSIAVRTAASWTESATVHPPLLAAAWAAAMRACCSSQSRGQASRSMPRRNHLRSYFCRVSGSRGGSGRLGSSASGARSSR